MPARWSYVAATFDAGLVQHRATFASLVAVALAPAGSRPGTWAVSRISSRGAVKWTVRGLARWDVRRMMVPDCAGLAAVLRAIEAGRL